MLLWYHLNNLVIIMLQQYIDSSNSHEPGCNVYVVSMWVPVLILCGLTMSLVLKTLYCNSRPCGFCGSLTRTSGILFHFVLGLGCMYISVWKKIIIRFSFKWQKDGNERLVVLWNPRQISVHRAWPVFKTLDNWQTVCMANKCSLIPLAQCVTMKKTKAKEKNITEWQYNEMHYGLNRMNSFKQWHHNIKKKAL